MSIAANLKKTYYYFKKNGIADTYYAIRERLYARTSPLYMAGYTYQPVLEAELEKQRKTEFTDSPVFSILVPMYETKAEFAKEMIDSVLAQTYSNWELILADASLTDSVKKVVSTYTDERIRYVKLEKNSGISENTNEALRFANGDYIGLLDHDDLLTPDALYEMAVAITGAKKNGKSVAFAYSDEDKCDTEVKKYYEPNIKPGFNLDLLLSNNYICHFLVMKTDLMKRVGFRAEFDGAQDYDLVLRAFLEKDASDDILHINRVLYHWRCHDLSTAANPQSKLYAYEAGKRAVESALVAYFTKLHGSDLVRVSAEKGNIYVNNIVVSIDHTRHNGFYRTKYGAGSAEDVFAVRKDVAVIAGPIVKNNKITGGILDKNGVCTYMGLPAGFSGYMHRMALQQDCDWVDGANAKVNDIHLDKLVYDGEGKVKLNCDLTEEKGVKILYDPLFKA